MSETFWNHQVDWHFVILCTPSLLPLPHKNSQSLTASLAAPPSGVSKLSLAFSCVTRFALRDLFMVEITPTYGRPFFDFPFIQFREYRSTNDIIIYIYRYRYMCVYVCIYIYCMSIYVCCRLYALYPVHACTLCHTKRRQTDLHSSCLGFSTRVALGTGSVLTCWVPVWW